MSRDYHSTTSQEILRKLVDREVIMCGTDIVEYSVLYRENMKKIRKE